MTRDELIDRIDISLSRSLDDEGVMTADQSRAVKKAILGTVITLLNAGAITVPRLTPAQEAMLRDVDRQGALPGDD